MSNLKILFYAIFMILGIYWSFQMGFFKADLHDAKTIRLIQEGKYEQAINLLNKSIRCIPCANDVDAHHYLGWCYRDLKQYSRALEEFNAAINTYKDIPCFLHIASRITCHLKGMDPNSLGDIYLWRGFSYMALQNYEHAIADYTDAVNWSRSVLPVGSPNDGYPRYLRCVCYFAIGQDLLAQKDIEQLKKDEYWGYLGKDTCPTKSNCYQIIQRSVK